MTNRMKQVAGGLVLALALSPAAVRGQDIIVHNLPMLMTDLTGEPLGLPVLAGSWNIPQYNGALPLMGVKLELVTKLTYQGTIQTELAAGDTFNLQVRSDFTVDFLPAQPGTVSTLDPAVILSLMSTGVGGLIITNAMASSTQTTMLLPADFAAYTGAGTVPVTVNGSMLTTPPAALGWFNGTDSAGDLSPATFVDDIKAIPQFGFQDYKLEANLIVTYFVPEAEVPAAALLGLGLSWYALRRRSSSR